MTITTKGVTTVEASWAGGPGRFSVSGAFPEGLRVVLLFNDGTNWIPLGPEGVFGSPGACRFELPSGDPIGIEVRSSDDQVFSLNVLVATL